MLDAKLLRTDPEAIARNLARRGFVLDVGRFRALEDRRKAAAILLAAERDVRPATQLLQTFPLLEIADAYAIQGYTIARTLESTEAELMHTVFPHPTLSEMMHEAVLAAYGRPIHI